jgi:hypothetical protein
MKSVQPWTPLSEYAFRFYKIGLGFMLNPITPWFVAGMVMEAFGLALQSAMGFPTFPGLDFLVGAVIMMFLFYYQRKEGLKENEEDDDVESKAPVDD